MTGASISPSRKNWAEQFGWAVVILILILFGTGMVYFYGNQAEVACRRWGERVDCRVQTNWWGFLRTEPVVLDNVQAVRWVEECDEDGCLYDIELQGAAESLLLSRTGSRWTSVAVHQRDSQAVSRLAAFLAADETRFEITLGREPLGLIVGVVLVLLGLGFPLFFRR